ncbi:C4-dicarboxylate ABC transporter permease [Afifella sp. IM 167]|nr:C4-dicarboxylate ABC transporter permease [Afifella sp. IM 167]
MAGALGQVNRMIAIVAGIALLLTVALILLEIVLRQTSVGSIGGSDEISGYVMAGVATWGFAFALSERAHVRIDLIQARLPKAGAAIFDIFALAGISAIAALVSFYAWDVLAKTLARDSHANTPLATPLWIPQSIWFAGWVWLAIVSVLLLACVLALAVKRDWTGIDEIAGSSTESAGT